MSGGHNLVPNSGEEWSPGDLESELTVLLKESSHSLAPTTYCHNEGSASLGLTCQFMLGIQIVNGNLPILKTGTS